MHAINNNEDEAYQHQNPQNTRLVTTRTMGKMGVTAGMMEVAPGMTWTTTMPTGKTTMGMARMNHHLW